MIRLLVIEDDLEEARALEDALVKPVARGLEAASSMSGVAVARRVAAIGLSTSTRKSRTRRRLRLLLQFAWREHREPHLGQFQRHDMAAGRVERHHGRRQEGGRVQHPLDLNMGAKWL